MKSRLFAFLTILCIVGFIATDALAKKPDKLDTPRDPDTELIEFYGDLNGFQEVEDCCPNAGPFPEYTMTLSFAHGGFPAYTPIDGQLFINSYRIGKDRGYIVQFFWTEDSEGFGIEIIGGKVYNDKKAKILSVDFTGENCVDLYTKNSIATVNFTLVRAPN